MIKIMKEKFVTVHSRSIYTADDILKAIKEMDQEGYDFISVINFPSFCNSGDLYFKLRDYNETNVVNEFVECSLFPELKDYKSIEWIKPLLENPLLKKAAKNLKIQINSIRESCEEGLLVILEDHQLNNISNYFPIDMTNSLDLDYLKKRDYKLECPILLKRKNKNLYLVDGSNNLNYCFTYCIKPVVFWINIEENIKD